jgi:hypothetical protein
MQIALGDTVVNAIPKTRHPRRSYNENVDEPAKLIESEPVDVEAETPAEENAPVEGIEQEDESGAQVFEDDEPSS